MCIKHLASVGLLMSIMFHAACGLDRDQKGHNAAKNLAQALAITDIELDLIDKKKAILVKDFTRDEKYQLDPESKESLNELEEDLVLESVVKSETRGNETPLVAYVSDRDEADTTEIVAYDEVGNEVLLDPHTIPDRSVIVLSRDESFPIANEIEPSFSLREAEDLAYSHKLDQVTFLDVHEPWYKGRAEVYMVVSYIGKDGKGASQLIELPEVEKANKTYHLNKIFHIWSENRYQILDISFLEHDSGYNYSDLTKIFITAAANITAIFIDPTGTTLAVVNAVSQVMSKVVDAIPSSFWTDDDDFIDSINTIEKYSDRSGYVSSRGDVDAQLSLFELKPNDE